MSTPFEVKPEKAHHISVLFVDDEPAILRLISRALAGAPYEILVADGPLEALAIMKARPVDVLVTDVEMPDMNGLELVKLARRDYPDTVRILITANATMERALHAINEGEVHRFYTKPFDATLFRKTMEALVERVEKARRTGGNEARAARREQLFHWLDNRFPGLRQVSLNAEGELEIDVDAVIGVIDAAGVAKARDQLRREG